MVRYSIVKQKTLLILESGAIFLVMLALLTVIGIQLFGFSGLLFTLGGVIFIVFATTRKANINLPNELYPLSYDEAPRLHDVVRDLSEQARIPHKPELYIYPVKYLNAATLDKPGNPLIILTLPLVKQLNERELTALLAHEIAHIQYRDFFFLRLTQAVHLVTRVAAVTAWIIIIMYLPVFLFSNNALPVSVVGVLIGAPFLSVLLQLAFSRSREFNADLGAAELTNDPEGLAVALKKIDKVQSHLLRMILPVPQRNREGTSLFRSHPAIDKRIKKLEQLRQLQK